MRQRNFYSKGWRNTFIKGIFKKWEEREKGSFFLLFLLIEGSLSIPLFFFHLPSEVALWEWDEESSYINLATVSSSVIYLEQTVILDLKHWEPGFPWQWLFCAVTLSQLPQLTETPQFHRMVLLLGHCIQLLSSSCQQQGRRDVLQSTEQPAAAPPVFPVLLGADLLLMWRRFSTPGCFGHIQSTACPPDQTRWDITAFCSWSCA